MYSCKKLLMQNLDSDCNKQQDILSQHIQEWMLKEGKHNYPQVDDITIMGKEYSQSKKDIS